MEKETLERKFIIFPHNLLIVIIAFSIISCNKSYLASENDKLTNSSEQTNNTSTDSATIRSEDYKAILIADSNIFFNETCELRLVLKTSMYPFLITLKAIVLLFLRG
jgi:hypothetical protein